MEFDQVHWDMYKAMKRKPAISCDPRKGVSFDEGYGREYKERLASRKPLMKSFGRLAFGSSSARKYLRMWGNCFQ